MRQRTVGRLLLLALAGYGVLAAVYAVDDLRTALREPQSTDYLAFAGGARVLNSGSTCLYCLSDERAAEVSLLGAVPHDQTDFPNRFVNPPLAAFVLRPVSRASLQDGVRIFVEVSALCIAVAALLLLNRVGAWRRRDTLAGLGLALAVFSLPGLTALRLAQWAPLLLLAATGALLAAERGRHLTAGALLSVLLIKPQLVWLCVPLLLLPNCRRMFAGFVAGASVWFLSGVAIIGPGHLRGWLDAMTGVGVAGGTEGLPGLAAALWGRPGTVIASTLLGALAVAVGLRLRHRIAAAPPLAILLGLAMSLAFSPHAYPDDLLLLAVPLVLWIVRAPTGAVLVGAALSAAWLFDRYASVWSPLRHTEALVACVIALGAAWMVERRPQPFAPAGAEVDLRS